MAKPKLTKTQKKHLKDMPFECVDFSTTYKPCHKLAELGLATETPVGSYGRIKFERTPEGDSYLGK